MSSKNDGGISLPARRTTGETLQDRLTENAYDRILPARYLKKDADGNPVEEQEDLFKRVARNVAVAEAIHVDEEVTITEAEIKPDHPRRQELIDEVFGHPQVEGNTEWRETTLTEKNAKYVAYDPLVERLESEGFDAALEQVTSTAETFRDLMENLEWTPNSPTLMNAGDELQQLSACFVDSPADDMADIKQTEKEASLVFQSGGGMGYAFWRLRPYGDVVGSTGGIASGPMTFMRTYDENCGTIAQGGARRGAQMGIMRVSHPDVIWFIHAKRKDVSLARQLLLNDPDDFRHTSFGDALEEARELIDDKGRVPDHLRNAVEGNFSNFNISVGLTEDFMEAVQNDEEYTFTNPRTGEPHIATRETKDMYGWFGLDHHVEVGEPLSVPAEEVFTRIVEGAHENGEPGTVFLDRINDKHSFPAESTPDAELGDYEIAATNPCGEQPLMEYEPCNLGHINLSTLAKEDRDLWIDFDGDVEEFLEQAIMWDEFDHRIRTGTRFLDNVVTMSDFPIPEIEKAASENRKVGLGIMGLAQLYVQLGVEYGSPVGNEIAEQLMTHINHTSKTVSNLLSAKRGNFDNWEDSKYADPTEYAEWFEHHVGEPAEEWEDGYPIRNHNTTTIAPTGTTSMVGNTSGGCEPIYSVARYKNVSDDVQGEEKLVEFDDYFLNVLEENDIEVDPVKREAVEQMEANNYEGIDGLDTVPDTIGELFVVTSDLDAKDHALVQCALQKGVDSAISKTTNAPEDQTVEGAKETFMYVYENGGKGVTYYRQGSRSKQVLTTNDEEWADDETADEVAEVLSENGGVDPEEFESVSDAVDAALSGSVDVESDGPESDDKQTQTVVTPRERPSATYGSTRRVSTGYGTLYVTINEDEKGLHEVFGTIGKSGGFTESMVEGLCRMASQSLRSGVPAEKVAEQLENIQSPKSSFDQKEQVASIPDGIAKAIQRHIEDPATGFNDFTVESDKNDAQTAQKEGVTLTNGGATKELVDRGSSPECPSCGSMLQIQEGCEDCPECGYSKC
jgi:ribonucleoside-diphosphate reductase alpha chain